MGISTCSCPGFFVIMAVCGVTAIVCGSRLQRLSSIALLIVSIVGFVIEYRAEQLQRERLPQILEAIRQRARDSAVETPGR